MLVAESIQHKLTTNFAPSFLNIENDSHLHSSGRGSESHFKVTIVSDAFEGKRNVARHQAVYACLQAELDGGVHALALHLYTPAEWQERGEIIPNSMNCLGIGK